MSQHRTDKLEDFSSAELEHRLHTEIGAKLKLPSGLCDVLHLAYHLSLETEEARTLRFTLVISKNGQMLPSEQRFQSPLSLNLETLRRLCVVVDPRRMCLHIEAGARGDALIVTGIAARPSLPGLAHWQVHDIALIEVLGPGQIGISAAEKEVRFDRHKYFPVDRTSIIERNLLSSVPESIVERCTTPTSIGHCLLLGRGALDYNDTDLGTHNEAIKTAATKLARLVAVETLEQIVRMAIRGGHGASFIITDTPLGAVLPGGHEIVTASRGGVSAAPWNCGMLDYVGWGIHVALAKDGITVLKDAPQNKEKLRKWADSIGYQRLRSALELMEIDDLMRFQLSSTDGAVVLDCLLQPRMFGARFTVEDDVLPEASRDYLKQRGLRHRSTACAVHTLSPAMGFTISQDGSVTLFRRVAQQELECIPIRF